MFHLRTFLDCQRKCQHFYKIDFIQMASLKLIHEVDTAGPISELSRMNHLIFGYNGDQDILQIDIKHHLLIRNAIKFPPINVKCLKWQGKQQYFITLLNKINLFQSGTINESNSKAQFTGLIDSLGQGLLFSKYHHNYQKHSINYWWEGSKKILKLSDTPYSKLIFNPCTSQVIYSIRETVSCFDINQPEKQTVLLKKSSFLQDSSYLYYLSINLESRSKSQFDCGIFDFRNGKNINSWISRDIPIKIESFGNVLTVASKQNIDIYDMRKLVRPFLREASKGIKDFIYEPNIGKLYVGCQNKLKVYATNY